MTRPADAGDPASALRIPRRARDPLGALGHLDARGDLVTVHAVDGTCLVASPAVERILGHQPAAFVGTAPYAHVHPDDVASLRAGHAAVLAGEVASVTVRLRHRDGYFVWVATTMHAAPAGALDGLAGAERGVAIGITRPTSPPPSAESQRLALVGAAARALDAHEQLFRTLFNGAPTPIWCFDPETLRFVAVNEAAVALYGWSREEFLAMTLHDVRPPDEQASLAAALRAASRDPHASFSGTFVHWTRDGAHRRIEVHARMVPLALGDAAPREETTPDGARSSERSTIAVATDVATDAAPARRGLWLSVLRDVTAFWEGEQRRRELERSLAAEHARLRQILDALPAAVMVCDAATGAVTLANATALATQGSRSIDEYAAELGDLRRPDHVVAFDAEGRRVTGDAWPATRAFQGETVRGLELRLPGRRAGDPTTGEQWVRVAAAPLVDADGRIAAAVVAGEDITREKQLEARVRTAGLLAAVGRLAADVSHDFANLLVVVKTGVTLALEQLPPDHPARADLADVHEAASRGAALTRQLLSLTQHAPSAAQPHPIGPLAGGVLRLARRLLPESITLETTLSLEPYVPAVAALGAGVPSTASQAGTEPATPRIAIDRGRFEQQLLNLVVNARDAMPTGGVLRVDLGVCSLPEMRQLCAGSIAPSRAEHEDARGGLAPLAGGASGSERRQESTDGAAPDRMASDGRFAAAQPARFARLTITDTGVGIDPAIQARIFEPFFSTKGAGGSGIGLATAASVVHAAGGELALFSRPGAGTRIELFLPLLDGDDAPIGARTEAAGARPSAAAEAATGAEATFATATFATTTSAAAPHTTTSRLHRPEGDDATHEALRLRAMAEPRPLGTQDGTSPDARRPTRGAADASPVRAAVGADDGGHVLVVDDEPSVRRVVRRLLETDGHRVTEAVDGVDALACWHALAPSIDVIVTDGRMPRMDGWTFAAELRRRGVPVPILLVSGATNGVTSAAPLDWPLASSAVAPGRMHGAATPRDAPTSSRSAGTPLQAAEGGSTPTSAVAGSPLGVLQLSKPVPAAVLRRTVRELMAAGRPPVRGIMNPPSLH